jgi:hypothetical protein
LFSYDFARNILTYACLPDTILPFSAHYLGWTEGPRVSQSVLLGGRLSRTGHLVLGWSVLDALYFSVITLTTVGYGDFSPQTPAGKKFTMIYVLIGLGLISGFVFLLAERTGIIKKNEKEKEEKN